MIAGTQDVSDREATMQPAAQQSAPPIARRGTVKNAGKGQIGGARYAFIESKLRRVARIHDQGRIAFFRGNR